MRGLNSPSTSTRSVCAAVPSCQSSHRVTMNPAAWPNTGSTRFPGEADGFIKCRKPPLPRCHHPWPRAFLTRLHASSVSCEPEARETLAWSETPGPGPHPHVPSSPRPGRTREAIANPVHPPCPNRTFLRTSARLDLSKLHDRTPGQPVFRLGWMRFRGAGLISPTQGIAPEEAVQLTHVTCDILRLMESLQTLQLLRHEARKHIVGS